MFTAGRFTNKYNSKHFGILVYSAFDSNGNVPNILNAILYRPYSLSTSWKMQKISFSKNLPKMSLVTSCSNAY